MNGGQLAPAALGSYATIRPAMLLHAAGGDRNSFIELLDIFLRIAPPMVAGLRGALGSGAAAAIAEQSHGLKSCVALLGADAASKWLARLESSARRGMESVRAGEFDGLGQELERIVAEARDCRTRIA